MKDRQKCSALYFLTKCLRAKYHDYQKCNSIKHFLDIDFRTVFTLEKKGIKKINDICNENVFRKQNHMI